MTWLKGATRSEPGVKMKVENTLENNGKEFEVNLKFRSMDDFEPEKIDGFYGKTKAEAAQYVQDAVLERGLNASIVFPSGLCGPGDYAGGHERQAWDWA